MRKIIILLIILTISLPAFAADSGEHLIYVEMPSTYKLSTEKPPESPVRVSFDLGAGIGTSTKDDPMKVKPVFELDITTKYKEGLGLRPVLHFDIEATDAVALNLSLGARYYWERFVVGLTAGMNNFKYFDLSGIIRYRFPVGWSHYETVFVYAEGIVHYVFDDKGFLRFGLLGGIEL